MSTVTRLDSHRPHVEPTPIGDAAAKAARRATVWAVWREHLLTLAMVAALLALVVVMVWTVRS